MVREGSTAKVKVGTMNSDTQGETVDYVYMLRLHQLTTQL